MIPKDFAPWESVYYYFSKWKNEGVIEELLDNIRSQVRTKSGREKSPSLGIIDSRSVKTSHHVDPNRGLDGNKKVKGRKQHMFKCFLVPRKNVERCVKKSLEFTRKIQYPLERRNLYLND